MKQIQQLLIQAQSGNLDAEEQLVKYYLPLIKSVVNKFIYYLKDNKVYEDLMQDGKLLFLELLASYNPSLSNFGYYIKQNFQKLFYQKNAKFYFENNSVYQLNITDTIETYDIFNHINTITDLSKSIEKLPNKQRLAVRLYFFMDLTQAQCAEYLAINQPAFSRLLSRALKNLKKFLQM